MRGRCQERKALFLNDVMNFSGGVTNTGAITAHFSAINIATNVTALTFFHLQHRQHRHAPRGLGPQYCAASSAARSTAAAHSTAASSIRSIFSSGRNGIHIEKVGAALFSGNSSNGGALTAANDTAIAINLLAMGSGGTFSGNIINSGAINSPGSVSWKTSKSASGRQQRHFPRQHQQRQRSPPMPTALKFNRSAARCSPGTSATAAPHCAFRRPRLNEADDSGTFDGSIGNAYNFRWGVRYSVNAMGAALFSGSIANSGTINATSGPGLNIACGRQRHVQRQHRQYGLDFRRAKRHCDQCSALRCFRDHQQQRRHYCDVHRTLVFNIANASGATLLEHRQQRRPHGKQE